MNESRPRVAVILPARNAGAHIGNQLEALSRQRQAPLFKVVVADNGSTDDTIGIARSFATRLDLMVLDASQRVGAAAARNVGTNAVEADLFLYCDADDVVDDRWVATMSSAHDGRSILAGGIRRAPEDVASDPLTWQRRFRPFAPTCNIGVPGGAMRLLGGFDERLRWSEDADFFFRAAELDIPLKSVPDAVVLKIEPSSAKAAFRQYFNYGTGAAGLYRIHREKGYPRSTLGEKLRDAVWLLSRLPSLPFRRPEARIGWCRRMGTFLGRPYGALRFKVWFW